MPTGSHKYANRLANIVKIVGKIGIFARNVNEGKR